MVPTLRRLTMRPRLLPTSVTPTRMLLATARTEVQGHVPPSLRQARSSSSSNRSGASASTGSKTDASPSSSASSSSSSSSPSPSTSTTATGNSASPTAKPLSKPVQLSYLPSKSGSGGGSITFSLPPHVLTALKAQTTPVAKSSKAKAGSASAAAKARTAPPSALGRGGEHERGNAEVFAWATAYEYDFVQLVRSGRLPEGWTWLEDEEVIYVPAWPPHASTSSSSSSAESDVPFADAGASTPPPSPPSGEIFILRSGSYVTWNLSLSQSQRFLRQVIQGRDVKHVVEKARYHEIGDETMECRYDPNEVTRIKDGMIVLGRSPLASSSIASAAGAESAREDGGEKPNEPFPATLASTPSSSPTPPFAAPTPSDPSTPAESEWTPLLAKLAFSQGLATSARLSVQESALSTFLITVSTIPSQLESTGRVPMKRRQVIQHMGTLLRLRQKANLDRDNFYDEPELYWDNARMEDHYRAICAELDISTRFETLNEKLDHGENLLGVVRALLTEGTTHRMELVIIALIAFEAGIAVLSHGWVPQWVVDGWTATGRFLGLVEEGVKEAHSEEEEKATLAAAT